MTLLWLKNASLEGNSPPKLAKKDKKHQKSKELLLMLDYPEKELIEYLS
jgi:hypothetical protein